MNELRCDHVVELVTDLVDGALPADEERDLVEHLEGCDGCNEYVEQYRRAIRTLGERPADETGTLTPEARAALLEVFRRSA